MSYAVLMGCIWEKTPKIWTRSGNGSKEKVKNRKGKDLEDWQRKYQSEQAQNRGGDKAERNVVVRLLKEGFISPKAIQFVTLCIC